LEGGINLSIYSPNPISWIDPWGLLKEGECAGYGTKPHENDNLDAHELLRNLYIHQHLKIPNNNVRFTGNPAMALTRAHHKSVHDVEADLRMTLHQKSRNVMLGSAVAESRLMTRAIKEALIENPPNKIPVITRNQLATLVKESRAWTKEQGIK
jgi:hypothetical protein